MAKNFNLINKLGGFSRKAVSKVGSGFSKGMSELSNQFSRIGENIDRRIARGYKPLSTEMTLRNVGRDLKGYNQTQKYLEKTAEKTINKKYEDNLFNRLFRKDKIGTYTGKQVSKKLANRIRLSREAVKAGNKAEAQWMLEHPEMADRILKSGSREFNRTNIAAMRGMEQARQKAMDPYIKKIIGHRRVAMGAKNLARLAGLGAAGTAAWALWDPWSDPMKAGLVHGALSKFQEGTGISLPTLSYHSLNDEQNRIEQEKSQWLYDNINSALEYNANAANGRATHALEEYEKFKGKDPDLAQAAYEEYLGYTESEKRLREKQEKVKKAGGIYNYLESIKNSENPDDRKFVVGLNMRQYKDENMNRFPRGTASGYANFESNRDGFNSADYFMGSPLGRNESTIGQATYSFQIDPETGEIITRMSDDYNFNPYGGETNSQIGKLRKKAGKDRRTTMSINTELGRRKPTESWRVPDNLIESVLGPVEKVGPIKKAIVDYIGKSEKEKENKKK